MNDVYTATVAFIIGMVVSAVNVVNNFQTNIIEHGYGLYCPNTSDFAFNGECE